MIEFAPWPKMGRLFREIVVTEKIDGTNAQILIDDATLFEEDDSIITEVVDGLALIAGSRTRYITPANDNFGFAKWVKENATDLVKLGIGRHYGEWWGKGIQRGYGLDTRKFSLFNTGRWKTICSDAEGLEPAPGCCDVVPVLYRGMFSEQAIDVVLRRLKETGSVAAPGFMNPEGIITYHTHANVGFKTTLDNNDEHKGI